MGPGSIPFGFLEEIHQRFVRSYGRAIHSAQAYSMNDEFSRVLSQQMEYYSNDPNADRVSRIKVEMSQVLFSFLNLIYMTSNRFSSFITLSFDELMEFWSLLLTFCLRLFSFSFLQVRNVMIENIDKVLDRGERLELLVDKTANMQGNTFRFRKQARRFRTVMWWRNVKLT